MGQTFVGEIAKMVDGTNKLKAWHRYGMVSPAAFYLSQRQNLKLVWPYVVLMKRCELLFLGGWRTEAVP